MKKLVSIILVCLVLVSVLVLPADAVRVDEIYGDVNKDKVVNTIDATIIQRHLAKIEELVSLEYALADFNNDKEVTILDATTIQQVCAKLIEKPREIEEAYLDYYIEIEDIIIKPMSGAEILETRYVNFTPVFDEVYDYNGAGRLKYTYTFTSLTDETYVETVSSDKPVRFYHAFPKAGEYEVKLEVQSYYYTGVYSFTKRFEVLKYEQFEFDNKLAVDYSRDNRIWYDTMPKDTVDIAFEKVVSINSRFLEGEQTNTWSTDYIVLLKSKTEYDKLFNFYNDRFTDEFFETKYIVAAVTQGYDSQAVAPIVKLARKENKLYVDIDEYSLNTDGWVEDVAPLIYYFVSVDKADVEGIEYLERAEGRAVFEEPYDYHDNCVYFRTYDPDYVPTLEKFSPYGVVEIRKFDSYQYLLMLDKHDIENLKSTVQALQDDEELCKFWFGPLNSTFDIEQYG